MSVLGCGRSLLTRVYMSVHDCVPSFAHRMHRPSQRWRMRDPGARTCEHLVKVTVTGAMRKTMDQFKPLPMRT